MSTTETQQQRMPTRVEVTEWLIQRDIFPGLQPKDIVALARTIQPIAIADGEVLVRRNDPGDSLFIVFTGSLNVVLNEHEEVLVTRKPGEILGEMSILNSKPRSATLVAGGETIVLSLSKRDFERLALDSPKTVLKIAKLLVERLQGAMESLQIATEDKLQKEREAAEMRVHQERERRKMAEAELELAALRAEDERKAKELEKARELQRSLLPAVCPNTDLFCVAVHHETATEVGGDYYDFFPCRDGSFNIIVGDATGHGLHAGIIVSVTKALACASAHKPYDTRRFGNISDSIEKMGLQGYYMALMTMNITSECVKFVSASMPPILRFIASENRVEQYVIRGLPMGLLAGIQYDEISLPRESGDVYLLFSDGVNERFNPSGEMFGIENVINVFQETARKGDPLAIKTALLQALHRWAGSETTPPEDDVTFVVVCMK